MRREFIATVAGLSALTMGCEAPAPQNPTPSLGELEVAHTTSFAELVDGKSRTAIPLEIGSKVMGICIVFTRAESATINSGLIRVQYGDKVGQVPTYAGNLPYEPVDTFRDKTEADLVNEYPRCDDYDEAQKTRSTAV